MNSPLKTITVNPQKPPNTSIIMMHGLGADANDLSNLAYSLKLPPGLAVRFVFPDAPMRPIRMLGGEEVRAWFDIDFCDGDIFEDESGIKSSTMQIDQLIADEIERGISSERIILAGFSQGGVMAMQCGLRYPKALGGILVLSGFLLLQNKLRHEMRTENQKTPVLMMHGTQDLLIPIDLAKKSCVALKNMELNVELLTYPMDHTICLEEIEAIGQWVSRILI